MCEKLCYLCGEDASESLSEDMPLCPHCIARAKSIIGKGADTDES